jgi:hypothetical protein
MAENTKGAEWVPLIVVLICIFGGGWLGYELGKHRTRVAAVRAGVAEFYLADPIAQSPDFRWKTNLVNRKGE